MSELEHGRFSGSEKVTDFRCRFCNMPATIWLRIPLSTNSKEMEYETFCDNHAQQISKVLMKDTELRSQNESAKRIEEAQIAHETA